MEVTGRAVGSLLVRLICVLGFVWQVSNVSSSFFQYKTTSKVLLNSREAETLPQLQLCFTYSDILDWDRVNRQSGTKYSRTDNEAEIRVIQSNLTIAQILDNVPAGNESIASCRFRDPRDGLLMLYREAGDCLLLFQVRRYYVQSFVCYTYNFTADVSGFSAKQVANSLVQPSLLYGVALTDAFDGADLVGVTLFFGQYPTVSRQYSINVNRLIDFKSREPRNNVYVFGYSLNRVTLMPAPFDTRCNAATTDESANQCQEECMKPLEEQLGKITYTTFTHHPINEKHVSYADLVNETRGHLIKSYVDTCFNRCTYYPCHYNYTITLYDIAQRLQPPSRQFRPVARTPKAPGLDVQFEARLSLMEFVIFVCSCVGIWFGLSVLSIDPFRAILLSQRLARQRARSRVRINPPPRPLLFAPPIRGRQ